MKLGKKFTIYIGILISILTVTMLLFIAQSNVYADEYQKILYNVYVLNETYNKLEETQTELEKYLTTQKPISNESFNRKFDELYRSINSMPIEFSTREEQFAYSNIRGMLISLNLKIEDCLRASRGREAQLAKENYEQAEEIEEQMKATIDYLVLKYMSASHELYNFIERDRMTSQKFTIIIIICIVIAAFISMITFVKKLTDSLQKLSESVSRFAEEPESSYIVEVESKDEIGFLANAFNIMARDIRSYIGQINENMRVENELKKMELKMLQSQINPHFLFNTLNCIAQNAMLENADNTYSLILTVSGMLRYNLRKLDAPVTIGEEIDNLKKYISIQEARYGDRIKFFLDEVEEDTFPALIPCLTIQPIVENSVIHGFEAAEKKGSIFIKAKKKNENIWIHIIDNGAGMNEEMLGKIKSGDAGVEIKGHSTGIGIKNVIYRLKLFYGRDVFYIESKIGEGTKITLIIPYDMGGITDEFTNC